MTPTTDKTPDLDELRRLLERATKGPWEAWLDNWIKPPGALRPEVRIMALDRAIAAVDVWEGEGDDANAALIVAAVNALPRLLSENTAQARRIEAAEKRAEAAEGERDAERAMRITAAEERGNAFAQFSQAERRIGELNERLENNRMFNAEGHRIDVEPGTIPDGIECRDETIRQQDAIIDKQYTTIRHQCEEIGKLHARMSGLMEALRPFAFAFEFNSTDGPCLTEADVRGMHNAIDVQCFRQASAALTAHQAQGGGD